MSHPNAALVTKFYEAFQRKDGEAMAASYAPNVTFSDPVFQELRGAHAGNMWRMLTGRAKDLAVTFRDVTADDAQGTAHWEATYTFATGRKVHNVIDARFRFENGRIVEHHDTFDFPKWSRQALGPVAAVPVVGGLLRAVTRRKAKQQLASWESKRG